MRTVSAAAMQPGRAHARQVDLQQPASAVQRSSVTTNVALYRLPQVLARIPVSRSAWFAGIRSGLTARGLQFMPGVGVGADPKWQGEPSVLVLGLPLQHARALGTSYLQNAIVWCGEDAVPQLVLLR